MMIHYYKDNQKNKKLEGFQNVNYIYLQDVRIQTKNMNIHKRAAKVHWHIFMKVE